MFYTVGPPTIRLLPVELLLQPNRKPTVFRPKLSASEREKLLASLATLIGHPYDTLRVYSFIFRLAIFKYLGLLKPFQQDHTNRQTGTGTGAGTGGIEAGRRGSGVGAGVSVSGVPQYSNQFESYICTDAILMRTLNVSKDFQVAARKLQLDYSTLRSWSINDVTQLNRYRPNLLTQIALPAVNRIKQKVDRKQTLESKAAEGAEGGVSRSR